MIRCAYCHEGERLARLGRCTFCGAAHHAECYIENEGLCASCGMGDNPEPEIYVPYEPPSGCVTWVCCSLVFWLLVGLAIIWVLNW